MASRKVRASRARELERLGFDYVGNLYLELGGVRQLMNHLFEPLKGGEQVNTADFYYWLDKGNHRKKWLLVQSQRMADREAERPHRGTGMGGDFWIALHRSELQTRRKKEPLTWTDDDSELVRKAFGGNPFEL